jgi:hypothetical protein
MALFGLRAFPDHAETQGVPDGGERLQRNIKKGAASRRPLCVASAAQTKPLDDVRITGFVIGFQIVQLTAPLRDHFQKATAGMVVLAMRSEMFCQIADTLAENGNLYFW